MGAASQTLTVSRSTELLIAPLTVIDSIRSLWAAANETIHKLHWLSPILSGQFEPRCCTLTFSVKYYNTVFWLLLLAFMSIFPFQHTIFNWSITVQRWWRLHFRWSLHALPTKHQSNRNMFVCFSHARSNMYVIFLFTLIDIMVDKKINSLFRMYVCHTCGSRSLLFYFRISYPD